MKIEVTELTETEVREKLSTLLSMLVARKASGDEWELADKISELAWLLDGSHVSASDLVYGSIELVEDLKDHLVY